MKNLVLESSQQAASSGNGKRLDSPGRNKETSSGGGGGGASDALTQQQLKQLKDYKELLQQRDSEIEILVNMVKKGKTADDVRGSRRCDRSAYINNNNGYWATNGDIFRLAELMGLAMDNYLSGGLDNDGITNAYETTLSNYTGEKEKTTILNIQNDYDNERTKELAQLKQ